jgi:multidrug resistance efflux pump
MKRQMSKTRRVRVWFLAALLAVAAVAGLYAWRQFATGRPGATEGETRDRYATVRCGDFNIALEIDGNLDAFKHHMIRPEPRSGSRGYGLEIVELVENRSAVKTGDLLFRFSEEKHAVELDKMKGALADEQTSLKLAEQVILAPPSTANDHRQALELRVAHELAGRVERVHVEVGNAADGSVHATG